MQEIVPAGETLTFDGRPVDLETIDRDTVVALDNRGIVVIDVPTWKVRQELALAGGTSLNGLAWLPKQNTLYVSGAGSSIGVAKKTNKGFVWQEPITLPSPRIGGATYPVGLALSSDGKTLYACASRSNKLLAISTTTHKLEEESAVGVAPYGIALSKDGRTAFVGCWAAPRPTAGKDKALSAGSDVEVDERGIGVGGVVTVVDLNRLRVVKHLSVGLQPCEIVSSPDGRRIFVANANADTVTEIDTTKLEVVSEHVIHPKEGLSFGTAPNALTVSGDGRTLFVAAGGNNAVAVFDLRRKAVQGWIPAGWYPSAVRVVGRDLIVASAKGYGSRGKPADNGGRSVYSYTGTVSKVRIPSQADLAQMTAEVVAKSRILPALAALERSATGVPAKPIPEKLGGPSPIQHVFYVIKENRTYDQVFGDLPQGDGDVRLCTYPRNVTPNHHALAEQFVLLDNFYCNGVNSADGHAWSTEGNATAYYEHTFGGWTRSYPFGDDPLATSTTGYIWDNVLNNGLSFRNYGEFDYAEPSKGESFKTVYDDWVSGQNKVRFKNNIGVGRLRRYSNLSYPGWNMGIPDVLRASVFLEDLKKAEAEGVWPNFTIIYLPQDHNSGSSPGMPTPQAHMADNDLALGRVVEGISQSRFWSKSAVFVIEDDPQNGTDHIDGHRSICLVISPYAKRGKVVSDFFNQTSVLHTMQRILGLPPMNQMDAMAPVMFSCFHETADLTPYKALPANIPLDQLNPPATALKGEAKRLALLSAAQNWKIPDAVDDDVMNRAAWSAVRPGERYPTEWAGPHGRGLRAKGLKFDR